MNTLRKSFVFLLSVIMLMACQGKKEPVSESKLVETQDSLAWKNNLDVGDPASDPTNKSEPVSVAETSERIADLLAKWPLERLGKQLAIGGYFDSAQFHITGSDRSAVILWYCYNPSNTNHPELFVAIEQVPDYDTNRVLDGPVGNTFYKPINTFTYNDASNTSGNALTVMRTARTPGLATLAQTIPKARVQEYVANFKAMMATMQVLSGAKFCHYPYAAFVNNEYYRDFEGRDHKYVTYFFTLYFDTGHQPNYFRPVLGLAGQDGKLIETRSARGYEPMLQKSWPPPPNEK